MLLPYRISHRIAASVAAVCAGLALAGTASAVDLRDWGRTFPANQRFVVLSQFNNQAVLDKETQLVWERAPDSTPRSWISADYSRCGITAIGGRLGWRLPSRVEFMTLLDPNTPAPVKLSAGHPFVGITPNGGYWTSSRASNPDPVYDQLKIVVYIGAALHTLMPAASDDLKSLTWCVRGPE